MNLRITLIIVALIPLGIIASMFWKSYQSRHFDTKEDRTFASHTLDGLATIQIPTSFKLDETKLLETLHGYWGLPEGEKTNTFTYYFTRGAYTDWGGNTVEPVILGLQVFSSPADISAVAPASETSSDGYPLIYPRRTFAYTQGDLEKISSPVGEIDRVRARSGGGAADGTLLYYTDTKALFRVTLFYENGKLDDKAALNLFQQIIPTIKVQSNLIDRIKAITEDFYQQNPDKRPE